MYHFVTLLGFAALTVAVFAAHAASREPSQAIGEDLSKANEPVSNRLPTWEPLLSFHAPFSLN